MTDLPNIKLFKTKKSDTSPDLYAVFDSDYKLIQYSPNFIHFLSLEPENHTLALWDVFPELIGSEKNINKLQSNYQKEYILKNIAKINTDHVLRYYNLKLCRIQTNHHSTPFLVCQLEDMSKTDQNPMHFN